MISEEFTEQDGNMKSVERNKLRWKFWDIITLGYILSSLTKDLRKTHCQGCGPWHLIEKYDEISN